MVRYITRYLSITLILLFISFGNGKAQNTDYFVFEREASLVGNLGLSISNAGTIGRPNVRNQPIGLPSMEYPRFSGTEHLFEGGIWLGAVVNGHTRVSTSSVTSPSGYSIGSAGFEFSNDGSLIQVIEGRDNGAVSDKDVHTVFTDRYTNINGQPISGHENPLQADVELTVYSWWHTDYDNFKILEYKITNNSNNTWSDFYFGNYSSLSVRNVQTTTESGSAFFNKNGFGYLDDFYTVYAFDAGSNDFPSINTYAGISIVGSNYRGNYYHPMNADFLESGGESVPNISPSFWQFGAGEAPFDRPSSDIDRYNRLSTEFPLKEYREQLRTDGQDANGNYLNLLSIGPVPEILPGESITVYVAYTSVLKPEEYQGMAGKPIDTPSSRSLLTGSLEKVFEVITGDDLNDWDDMFNVPEYDGDFPARLRFDEVPSQLTYGVQGFEYSVYGPDPSSAATLKIDLNNGNDGIIIDNLETGFLGLKNIVSGSDSYTEIYIDKDFNEPVATTDELIDGENQIVLRLLLDDQRVSDQRSFVWTNRNRTNDVLVAGDFDFDEEGEIPLINHISDMDADYWYMESLLVGGLPRPLQIPSSETIMRETLKQWKSIVFLGKRVNKSFYYLSLGLNGFLDNGGVAFVMVPGSGTVSEHAAEVIRVDGRKELSTGAQRFEGLPADPIIPVWEENQLQEIFFRRTQIGTFPYLVKESNLIIYEQMFYEWSPFTGREELGYLPVMWITPDENLVVSGINFHELEFDESVKEMLDLIIEMTVNIEYTSSFDDRVSAITDNFNLKQNYPNPFNPGTVISYQIPVNSEVMLEVYDVLGRRVAVLEDGMRNAGWHQVNFDASALSSGIYIYRIQAGEFVETRKMMLVK